VKIVFLGNHTVGVRSLEAIAETEEIAGVVAHPPDPEDGVRYVSVHDHALAHGWPVIRAAGRDSALIEFVAAARADLLWITDYRYLVPRAVLALAPLGAINLHPSLLPRYRGRAPINWAILEGERRLGLTAHFVDEGVDSGDVIVQRSFELGLDQDVGDALAALYPLYTAVTREVLSAFRSGCVPRRAQDHSDATTFPARRPEDGLIDWSKPAPRVRDLVRAVARPYPGAFTSAAGRRLNVWRACTAPGEPAAPPGTVVATTEAGALVRCGAGLLVVSEIEWDGGEPASLANGMALGR